MSSSQSASAVSTRSKTCPRPSGTAAGNSSANGHSASNTSAPRASSTNQRTRNRLHRSIAPASSSAPATTAPSRAPATLSPKSTFDGTRDGRVRLQRLHQQRQYRRREHRHRDRGQVGGWRAAQPSSAQKAQGQQKPERDVTRHVCRDVEACPVPGQRTPQELPGGDALIPPARERVQAGIDDQRRIGLGQGPRGGLVHP